MPWNRLCAPGASFCGSRYSSRSTYHSYAGSTSVLFRTTTLLELIQLLLMKACEAFEYTLIFERILLFAHPRSGFGALTGSERQPTPLSRGARLTRLPRRWPFRRHAGCLCLAVVVAEELSLRNSDSLPSEQTGIHRPCAGANHGEGNAQCRKHDVHRSAAGGK